MGSPLGAVSRLFSVPCSELLSGVGQRWGFWFASLCNILHLSFLFSSAPCAGAQRFRRSHPGALCDPGAGWWQGRAGALQEEKGPCVLDQCLLSGRTLLTPAGIGLGLGVAWWWWPSPSPRGVGPWCGSWCLLRPLLRSGGSPAVARDVVFLEGWPLRSLTHMHSTSAMQEEARATFAWRLCKAEHRNFCKEPFAVGRVQQSRLRLPLLPGLL